MDTPHIKGRKITKVKQLLPPLLVPRGASGRVTSKSGSYPESEVRFWQFRGSIAACRQLPPDYGTLEDNPSGLGRVAGRSIWPWHPRCGRHVLRWLRAKSTE